MFRLIQIVIVLWLCGFELMAQDTIFVADFQSQSLGSFRTVDVDSLPLSEEFDGLSGGFQILGVSGPSDLRAVAISTFEDGGQADNWLMSPPIPITKESTVLKWTATSLTAEPTLLEDYRVMISRSGNEVEDFKDIAVIVSNESSNGIEREFDAGFYKGATIRVAFQHTSTDKYALSVDNIYMVEPGPENNATVVRLIGERYQNLLLPEIYVEVLNTGSDTLTSVELAGEIAGNAGSFTFEDLSVPPGELEQLLFSNLFPFEVGRYDITAIVTGVNGDAVSSNISVSSSYYMVSGGSKKKLVMEESTSTSCGWCPAGIVTKSMMYADYPSDFVAISVHDDDPMQLPLYDLGLSSQVGFGGTPSASLNRKEFVSAAEVDNYFQNEFSDVAPVRLDLEYDYNSLTNELMVELIAFPNTNLGTETHRFSFVIVEDFVKGEDIGYDQSNFFSYESSDLLLEDLDGNNWQLYPNPVPAADMIYNDVARELIGGFDGIPGSIPPSDSGVKVSYDIEYLMPSTFNESNISLIVMVIDTETGEIVNAHKEKLLFESDLAFVQSPTPFKLYPNPTREQVYLKLENADNKTLKYSLINSFGQTVQAAMNTSKRSDNEAFVIERNGLDSGMYFLNIWVDEKQYVQKILFL